MIAIGIPRAIITDQFIGRAYVGPGPAVRVWQKGRVIIFIVPLFPVKEFKIGEITYFAFVNEKVIP